MASALVTTSLLAVEAAAPPTAHAAEVPWDCTPTAYLFQSPGQRSTTVYSVDLVSGASTRVGSIENYVNAIGYNRRDDFMYGFDRTRQQLVRIGADLALTALGVPRNGSARLRTDIGWNAGDVDADGHLWMLGQNSGAWAEVDLTNNPPTLVAQGTATSSVGYPGDWAFIDGSLYGVVSQNAAGGTRALLVRFDTATKRIVNEGVLTALAGQTGAYGAVYTDGTYLYASNNTSGAIFRINPQTRAASRLSGGPTTTHNDGTRCQTAQPTVTVVKSGAGRLSPADQFTVALLDAAGDPVADATTSGTQTSVSTTNQPVRRGRTYFITDSLTDASTALPSDYTGSLSCESEDGAVEVTEEAASTWTVAIGAANAYVCTVTNTPDAATPRLQLTKTVSPTTYGAGDTLTYTFEVANTGNVPVSGIAITDVAFSGAAPRATPTCADTTLQPRTSTTCTTTYVVQPADVAAGSISSTSRATGTDPGGSPTTSNDASATASTTTPTPAAPSLAIEKSAAQAAAVQAGDTVRYEFAVTNTGNVTLSGVAVSEDAFNGTGAGISTPVCDRTTLTPGQQARCEATYTVTQADLDRAQPLANTARATGTDPSGTSVASAAGTANLPVLQSPELTLQKSASGHRQRARGRIVYRFDVTNTGNTTVSGLSIAETAFTGKGRLRAATCPNTTLAPGQDTICTVRYRLTRADVAAGSVRNAAVATGSDPQGQRVSSNRSSAKVGLPLRPRTGPRIATRVSDSRVTPGQRIHDRVRLTRVGKAARVKATARLYGPFSSRAAARCRPADLARSVTWTARRGWTRTPSVRVAEPGVYTWQVTTKPTRKIRRTTHPCGQRSETLTVAKPAYRPPTVNGGFSGTLLPPSSGRGSLPHVRAKAIGLDAAVLRAGVTRGAMDLPRDVGMVSWLRRSAGYDDAIGTTVIGGHVSDRHDRPGALRRLNQAHRGQKVDLVAGGKAVARFSVVQKASFPRNGKLPRRFFKTAGPHRLVLITCTDRVVYPNGRFHYTRYQVVVAKQVPLHRGR